MQPLHSYTDCYCSLFFLFENIGDWCFLFGQPDFILALGLEIYVLVKEILRCIIYLHTSLLNTWIELVTQMMGVFWLFSVTKEFCCFKGPFVSFGVRDLGVKDIEDSRDSKIN